MSESKTRPSLKHFLDELGRMPRLGDHAQFSFEALRLLIEGGEVAIDTLKVQVEDIEGDRVTLAFAFCDKDDRPIVNIGRFQLVGAGSTLTLSRIANSLAFTVS